MWKKQLYTCVREKFGRAQELSETGAYFPPAINVSPTTHEVERAGDPFGVVFEALLEPRT